VSEGLSCKKCKSFRGARFFGYAEERYVDFSAESALSPPMGLETTAIRSLRMRNRGGCRRQFLFACDLLGEFNTGS